MLPIICFENKKEKFGIGDALTAVVKSSDELAAGAKGISKIAGSATALKGVTSAAAGNVSSISKNLDLSSLIKGASEAGSVTKGLDSLKTASKGLDELGTVAKGADDLTAATKSLDSVKSADELADAAKGLKETDKVLKNSDEVADIAKKSDDVADVAKNTDNASDIAKNSDTMAKNAAEQAGKQTAGSVAKKVLAVAALGGGAYFAYDAYSDYNRKNGLELGIVSIKKNPENKMSAIINFNPREEISTNDRIEILESNCVPPLSGEFIIEKIITGTSIIVTIAEELKQEGTQGKFKLLTTFESQLSQNSDKVVGGTSGFLGDTIGSALEPVKNIFGSVIPDMDTFQIILIVCCCCCCLISSLVAFLKIKGII